jgi:hypothetical protein
MVYVAGAALRLAVNLSKQPVDNDEDDDGGNQTASELP